MPFAPQQHLFRATHSASSLNLEVISSGMITWCEGSVGEEHWKVAWCQPFREKMLCMGTLPSPDGDPSSTTPLHRMA